MVDSWQRLEELFHQCLALDRDARAEFIHQLRAENPALADELKELLGAEEDRRFLETDGLRSLSDPQPSPKEWAGQRFGPFEVEGVIGEGGMGIVLKARRVTSDFDQEVAIKVMGERLREGLHRRFIRERQTLARLRHPHIARLFDGGVTDEGIEYLVMEYIEGLPLDEYCDQKRLDLKSRLALFGTVCRAVHAAHEQKVIHRDLKPANILVEKGGSPKLVDFGIAKLIESEETDEGEALTRHGRVMTPEFASPEQVRGENVTSSSDVYSLGIVLYRLLCGGWPYRSESSHLHDLEKAVCDEAPLPPSKISHFDQGTLEARGIDEKGLTRFLRGRLDSVVLTAIQKDPERRYGSALEFADDIRRFLEGKPLSAYRSSIGERCRIFLSRPGWKMAAAWLLVLPLLAYALINSDKQPPVEESDPQTLVDTSSGVEQMLLRILQGTDPYVSGGEVYDRGVLDQAILTLEGTEGVHWSSEVRLRLIIGSSLSSLGDWQEARKHIDIAYEKALEEGQDLKISAQCLVERMELSLSIDDVESAEEDLVQLESTFEKLSDPELDLRTRRWALRAKIALRRYRFEEAERLIEKVLELYRETEEEVFAGNRISTLIILGAIKSAKGQFDSACEILEDCVKDAIDCFGPGHLRCATPMGNFAEALRISGRLGEAEEMARRCLSIRKKYLGESHPTYANTLSLVGVVLLNQGRLPEAEKVCDQALEVTRSSQARKEIVGGALNNAARIKQELGKHGEAETLFVEAMHYVEQNFGERHPRLATVKSNLALLWIGTGKLDEAEELLHESIAIRTEILGEKHPETISNHFSLAWVSWERRDLQEAVEQHRKVLALRREILPEDHPELQLSLYRTANALGALKRFDQAASLLEECVEIQVSVEPVPYSKLSRSWSLWGELVAANGDKQGALEILDEAIDWMSESIPEDSPPVQYVMRSKRAVLGDKNF